MNFDEQRYERIITDRKALIEKVEDTAYRSVLQAELDAYIQRATVRRALIPVVRQLLLDGVGHEYITWIFPEIVKNLVIGDFVNLIQKMEADGDLQIHSKRL